MEDDTEDIEGVAPNLGPEYEAKRAKMQEEVYQQNINNFLQKQDRLDRATQPTSNRMLTQHAKTAALKLFLNCRNIPLTVDGKKPLDIFLTEENRYQRTFVKGTQQKMSLL